jgi:hypothetical protein
VFPEIAFFFDAVRVPLYVLTRKIGMTLFFSFCPGFFSWGRKQQLPVLKNRSLGDLRVVFEHDEVAARRVHDAIRADASGQCSAASASSPSAGDSPQQQSVHAAIGVDNGQAEQDAVQ